MVRPNKMVQSLEVMPREIVTLAGFLEFVGTPPEVRDAGGVHKPCVICKQVRDVDEAFTAYCPCCRMDVHDSCCISRIPVFAIRNRVEKCKTDNAADLNVSINFERHVLEHTPDQDILCALCSSLC